ncbi:unnamed protein product [Mycena citricolor]|uniref:Thioredoxin domain-containing protein n=1 Tax=Mycena citricolor TaxID=2018698 RepID=A0AAD2Q5M6_9AGAR|nr:unnamed protein product [Mycena citricolor]CAK5278891.1 unnamed protein product [Mycena citricolor]
MSDLILSDFPAITLFFLSTMTSPNLIPIASPAQFQEALSADLARVSLIFFWAPWAAPCEQIRPVVTSLAAKYPTLLVLEVEAEEQADIAESFEIEAVPAFVVLRGHTLLGRISGADGAALTKAIATHLDPASVTADDGAEKKKEESKEELDVRLRALMTQSRVVLFMKGTPDDPRCGFSRKISALLRDQGVEFAHFDILSDDGVRQGLKRLNDWPTFPQLIVAGELVGGLDIVQEMVETGEFASVVKGE